MTALLSPMGILVRRHDPDRFFCALFAPATQREVLFTLYAFNHELARAREVASEPMLALIRLQWWREVVDGASKRHEVATPLSAAIAQGLLVAEDLRVLIDGREAEAGDGFATTGDWLAYLDATAGRLMAAAGRLLRARDVGRLRALGTAYGIAGQLRSVGVLARAGRCQLPADALAAAGLTTHDVIAHREPARLLAVLRGLAAQGQTMLRDAGGRLPSAAALPAVLARRDLRRIGAPVGPRRLGDRLAVVAAAILGRI
ncbi:MAG: squalene/phytoene synthase family protein [Acetobacteraceae bacterium]|nr:squalene/phytoene synthase family protein [Acetobacteraceae bacterium]